MSIQSEITRISGNVTDALTAIGAKGVTVPSGTTSDDLSTLIAQISGGASNHVTGTFTGTTTNAAMDIQIPYTGNGYPIAVMVFPTEGPYNSASGTFYSKIQRYACAYYTGIKARADRAPTYSASSSDTVATYSRYKNSTSSATSYSGTAANNTSLFTSDDAQNTVGHIVHIKPNNILSVFIASNSYGFMANVEYTYHIIYSE